MRFQATTAIKVQTQSGIREILPGQVIQMPEEKAAGLVAAGKVVPIRPRLTQTPDHGQARPYLDAEGDLVIPFGADPQYHWWDSGQSLATTLRELKVKVAILRDPASDREFGEASRGPERRLSGTGSITASGNWACTKNGQRPC
jgi:hypothetical protein